MNIFYHIDEGFLSISLMKDMASYQEYERYTNYKDFIKSHSSKEIFDNSEFYSSIAPDNYFTKNWEQIKLHLSPFIIEKYNITNQTDYRSVSEKFHFDGIIDSRFCLMLETIESQIPFKSWGEHKSFKSLKDYQLKIVTQVLQILEPQFGRTILQMPTGSGKTRTGIEISCHFINTNSTVLWLSDTEELADQAFDAFVEVWDKIGLPNTAAINCSRKKISSLTLLEQNRIVFISATIQGLTSPNQKEKLDSLKINYNNIGLVVFDEAHKSIAPTYERLVSFILGNSTYQCRLLGLTATPGRVFDDTLPEFAEEKNQNLQLSNFFNHKIIKLNDSQLETMNYLRSKGIIAELIVSEIEGVTLNLDNISEEEISQILSQNEGRNKLILESIIKLVQDHKRVLVFANSILHSKLIVFMLNSININSKHIDGESKNRSEIIKNFKKGNIKVLVNYGVLTTGYDDPKLECVMITRRTNSIVLYSQMIGRVLRGPAIGGTQSAKLVTIKDNIKGLLSNDEIFNFFDGYFKG